MVGTQISDRRVDQWVTDLTVILEEWLLLETGGKLHVY